MDSAYTNVHFGPDFFFLVLPILLVFVGGFYKPKFLLRYFSKVESWAINGKRKFPIDSASKWKYLMIPVTFILICTATLVAKMIKEEYWKASVFFGISYFAVTFFFILIAALVYGVVVFVITVVMIVFVCWLLYAMAEASGSAECSSCGNSKKGDFFDGDSWEDDKGRTSHRQKGFFGGEYMEDVSGNRMTKREGMFGGEYWTDDNGREFSKQEGIFGGEYLVDKDGKKITKEQGFFGGTYYRKE